MSIHVYLEYARGGTYMRQDKRRVCFLLHCVKRILKADPSKPTVDFERTQSRRKFLKSRARPNPQQTRGQLCGLLWCQVGFCRYCRCKFLFFFNNVLKVHNLLPSAEKKRKSKYTLNYFNFSCCTFFCVCFFFFINNHIWGFFSHNKALNNSNGFSCCHILDSVFLERTIYDKS